MLETNATNRLEQKIDKKEYNDADLVELTIPLNMPYFSDKDFEPVFGEIDWNGKHYRFVKRKVTGNVMHLLCLPHTEKNNIIADKNQLTRSLNDSKQDNKQENPVVKLIQAKYIFPEKNCFPELYDKNGLIRVPINPQFISQFDPQTPLQPPEVLFI